MPQLVFSEQSGRFLMLPIFSVVYFVLSAISIAASIIFMDTSNRDVRKEAAHGHFPRAATSGL